MALLNRITRLFKADFHAVIDQLEEPDVLLKQSVREMEAALQQDRQTLKGLQQQQCQFSDRIHEFENSITKIDEELNICFNAANEALARVLIKRKLECQQLHKMVNAKRTSLKQEIDQLQACIDEHAPRLEAMQQKLDLICEEAPHRDAEQPWSATAITITDADVDVALLREKQQRRSS